MTTELSDNERALLAREVAADQYDHGWPLRTTLGNWSREGFCAGWDAAMEYIEERRRNEAANRGEWEAKSEG